MRRVLIFILLILGARSMMAQLTGLISDENGNPLPYVSIYVQHTSKGATSNLEGEYVLKLDPGRYNINYQFVGYKTEVREIEVTGNELKLDIQLFPQATELSEVIITADAEDPAYGIIRKAIAKREFYKNYFPKSEVDVYVKGLQKVKDIPEKIFGIEIGDLDGAIDTSRKGIVYLSESISRLYKNGSQHKEIVVSSKISGNDQGYSFNSANEMEFDFYENTITLERQMVTPIASNALQYYKYRLEGSFIDEGGRVINQIAVVPKRGADPVFYGTIYIVEDEWNIHSLNLNVSSEATKIYVLDTLTFNQVFVPIDGTEGWALFSNTIKFQLNILGIKFNGVFGAVYSDYNMNPEFEEGFFDNYIHVVEEESNQKDSLYWLQNRPVPLTSEERIDYIRRDSISKVRKDPRYLDSLDRVQNKFEIADLLGGYSYRQRSKYFYLDVSSIISDFSFNTVQGYNLGMNIHARKYFDEDETRRIVFGANLNYGFSEEHFRANGYFIYRPSGINRQEWSLRGGSDIVQFNREEPISNFLNSAYSLLRKENFAKFHSINYVQLGYRHEPWAGIFLNHRLTWEDRIPLVNHSDHSFFRKEEVYQTNVPQLTTINQTPFMDRHRIFKVNVDANIRFGQKYVLYPHRRFDAGSSGPNLQLSYTGAFDVLGSDVTFHKLAGSLSDEWELGVKGRLQWYLNGGTFFNVSNIQFPDYRHFLGNEILFAGASRYARGFLNLPYYQFSTSDSYFQVHLQHHFDGWILDKIPGLNKLGWSLVAGAKMLKVSERDLYSEFHLGIDNIGFSFVRLLRVDAVMSLYSGDADFAFRISLGLN